MSWLISKALMNSLCSQEQVAEFLGGNSLDGQQSAQLSGNPTQLAYCAPDKMTDFSRLSRFGMTYKPLTESRGEELLTLYLEASPARTSASQDEAQELTVSVQECGEKWHASFAKYDPVTHSLRTPQCSLFEDLTECCVTLPRWGLMRDGECWEQQTLEQTIKGTESGLSRVTVPTPIASDYRSRGDVSMASVQRRMKIGKQIVLSTLFKGAACPMCVESIMGFPKGWTDLNPLETHSTHSVQLKPSESLAQTFNETSQPK